MTIDEIIKTLKFDKELEDTIYNEQFYEQLIEWLEELKWYKEISLYTQAQVDLFKQEERNKAIDDFAKAIKPYIAQYRSAIEHNRYAFIDVNNIAEQLKAGGKNEDI